MSDSEAVHVVCPQCGGVNRVPGSRLAEGGQCGKCKAALFQGKPLEVDDFCFERQRTRSDLPVLVDFWAPWCGPCKMMGPAFEQAAKRLEPHVRLLKLNTEAHQAAAGGLGIRSIPTMILFQGGRELNRISGALDANGIISWTKQTLGG